MATRSPFSVIALCITVVVTIAAAAPSTLPPVVTSAAYLSAESDTIDVQGWMRTLYGVRFDDEEQKCAAEDKVLYRPLNKCFLLFHRGPCQKYEWLVFDKEKATSGILTTVCRRRQCAPKWGYDAKRHTCFEQNKCQTPMDFHYTLFGEGVCRCNGNKGHLATASQGDSSACYELYHQKPCKKGLMVAPRYRLLEGTDAMCFTDPCANYKPPPGNVSVPATPTAASKPDVTTRVPLVRSGASTGRPPTDTHDRFHHNHNRESVPLGGGRSDAHRGAPTATRPTVRSVINSEANGNYFPRGRDASGGGGDRRPGGRVNVDVEEITDSSKPDLAIKSSTHGVIGSGGGFAPQISATHQHGNWNGHDHTYGHDHHHFHNHDFLPGRGLEPQGLPGFTISLKPMHVIVQGVRVRRDVIFPDRLPRDARDELNPHGDSGVTRHSRDAVSNEGGASRRNTDSRIAFPGGTLVSADTSPAGGTPTRSPPAIGAAGVSDDYALEVQYNNGERSCMTASQLNVICDLTMVPLFSDLSELKVPICVNALFRFALGRVGKSDECAENDAGVCSKKVVVKSSDPLDWELE